MNKQETKLKIDQWVFTELNDDITPAWLNLILSCGFFRTNASF